MKLRALIEQAKGVLMAEHRVGADAAFDLLRDMSQRENARLVDVAATVVGVTLPEEMRVDLDESVLPERMRPSAATSQRWLATRGQPAVRHGVAGAVVDVLAAARPTVWRPRSWWRTSWRRWTSPRSPCGGSEPMTPWSWSGRSATPATPCRRGGASRSASTSRSRPRHAPTRRCSPVTPPQQLDRFPAMTGSLTGYEALAAIPVCDGRQTVGVIGLSWTHEQTFTKSERHQITTLTTRVGRLLMRDLAPGDLELGNVTTVLGVLDDPWMILRALDDRPAGLVIEASAPGLTDIGFHVGERLLAAYPSLAADPLILDQLTALLRDGGLLVLQTPGSKTSTGPWGTAPVALRATRVGSRLIIAWRAQPTSQL
jgi:hypothetical protein